MWNLRNSVSAALLASLAALVIVGCRGDESVTSSSPEEPGQSPPGAPAAAGRAPAHGTDDLAPQWNAQEARVATCPAYKDAPGAEQMARWGWSIVEMEGDADATPESEEVESSASPTGSTRFEKLGFEAHVVRSSGDLAGLRVLRYTTRRSASAPGIAIQADAFDLLDGRPGRAPLAAGKRLFAIVFPDPYHQGDLGVAATFESEDDLLRSLPEGSPRESFEAVSEAIHAAVKAMPRPVEIGEAGK
jgi:hypothetical protein